MTYGSIRICAPPINHTSPHFTVILRMAIIGYLMSEHLLSRRHINDAAATGGLMWRDVSTPPWRSTSITCFSSRQISALRDVTEQRVRHIDVSFTSDVFFLVTKTFTYSIYACIWSFLCAASILLQKTMMLSWNKLCMDSMGEAMLCMGWMGEAMLYVNWMGKALLCIDWIVRTMLSIADTGATTWSIRSSTVTTRKANRVIGSWLIVDVTRHDDTHRQHCNSVYRLVT